MQIAEKGAAPTLRAIPLLAARTGRRGVQLVEAMNARQIVATIGWIWLVLGAMAVVAGLGGLMASTVKGLSSARLPVHSILMDFLWQHNRETSAAQVALGPLVVLTAVMFLRRRPWARVIIQALSAAMLAWVVWFTVYWLRALAFMTSDSDPRPAVMVVRIVMSVGGILVMGGFATAFGLLIWVLNRTAIKEVFRDSKPMA